jgi:hypothetical protein
MALGQWLFPNASAALLGAAVASACGDATKPGAPTVAPLESAQPCGGGDPAEQRHGAPCLCCHSDEFGVAGSVDRSGPPVAHVIVTDALGESSTLSPNSFGNFFRHFPMTAPVRAVVYGPSGDAISMRELSPTPDCNACHFAGGPVTPIHGP